MDNAMLKRSCSCREMRSKWYVPCITLCMESGQALIELALVLPIFVLLLLGAAEFARLAYASIEVSNAARAGIQYGAQNHSTAVDLIGMTQAAINDGSNIKTLQAIATNFCICSDGTSITCANASMNCPARILDYVQVNTSVVVDPFFHCPGLPKTFTLQGQAAMRVEE